jgi:hypothetical protein
MKLENQKREECGRKRKERLEMKRKQKEKENKCF